MWLWLSSKMWRLLLLHFNSGSRALVNHDGEMTSWAYSPKEINTQSGLRPLCFYSILCTLYFLYLWLYFTLKHFVFIFPVDVPFAFVYEMCHINKLALPCICLLITFLIVVFTVFLSNVCISLKHLLNTLTITISQTVPTSSTPVCKQPGKRRTKCCLHSQFAFWWLHF